ncbi:insulin-like growth factor-binding protein 4 [Mytilus galloprovincialis]
MSKLIVTATVLILSMIHISIVYGASLPCANCASVQCGPRPQGCELGKLPCGCCYVCAHNVGEICEAFAPSCATGLKCLTPAGLYDGRPPWYLPYFKGVCVTDPSLQLVPTSRTQH